LKSEGGREILLRLVEKADVLLESFRPGTMDRLGLGYEALRARNPRLIYGAVTGFGAGGPYSNRPGYDIIAQAMGGLMSITGQEGGPPTRSGNAMGDILGGMNLAIGVLAALRAREITGEGQYVTYRWSTRSSRAWSRPGSATSPRARRPAAAAIPTTPSRPTILSARRTAIS